VGYYVPIKTLRAIGKYARGDVILMLTQHWRDILELDVVLFSKIKNMNNTKQNKIKKIEKEAREKVEKNNRDVPREIFDIEASEEMASQWREFEAMNC